jgi:hypothetical protein
MVSNSFFTSDTRCVTLVTTSMSTQIMNEETNKNENPWSMIDWCLMPILSVHGLWNQSLLWSVIKQMVCVVLTVDCLFS